MHAVNILRNTPDIAIIELDDKDVIRHKLVRKIIQAYEKVRMNPPSVFYQ